MMIGVSPPEPQPTAAARVLLASCMAACLMALGVAPAQAQVTLDVQPGGILITHPQGTTQRLMKVAGKSGGTAWVALDNVGNAYPVPGYQTEGSGGEDDPAEEPIIVVDGYQSARTTGEDDPAEEPIIVVDGYQQVLDHLREVYDVRVEHDEQTGVDLLTMPGADDPLGTLLTIIASDSLQGRPLVSYFRLLEIASAGVFGDPTSEVLKPSAFLPVFPNDGFYAQQWNLARTRLAQAQWHPAMALVPVRIAVIDSGIGSTARTHVGLDGAAVTHQPIAPTQGQPVAHALGVVSLLADRSQDGNGIVGLLGVWETNGCYGRPALLAQAVPEVLSFNVGDTTPRSHHVAQAIRASVAAGVDVINLSLRLAYSPLVEEAIEEALAQGILVVAAAGNYHADAVYKPAAFPANLDGVIAVGAAGVDMTPTPTSAVAGVDIFAPGADVIVGGPGDGWYLSGGTSLAAPHVTAVLAMLRAVRPGLTPGEALEALQQRAQEQSVGSPGFLNALSTLNHVLPEADRVRTIDEPHLCGGYEGWASKQSFPYDDRIDDDLFPQHGVDTPLPNTPELTGAYPNPFNPATVVRFRVPHAQAVRLAVYNALGREIEVLTEGTVEAGEHEVTFIAHGLPSGVYFARLETPSGISSRSMVLVE